MSKIKGESIPLCTNTRQTHYELDLLSYSTVTYGCSSVTCIIRADHLAHGHLDTLKYKRLLKALYYVAGVDELVRVRPDACPPLSKLHSQSLASALVLLRDGI